MLAHPPKAAIFDLDGVLLDTEPLYTKATQRIASRYGKHFDWSLKQRTMGGDARYGAELVIEVLGLPLSVDDYLTERIALLRELFVDVPAMVGVESWIVTLRQHGLEIAVGTSSVRELCDIKWAPHSWLRDISVIVCGDDPEVRHRKPEPDIFLVAARRLGVSPEDCVVFEDSPAGVRAALRAGMQVVAIKAPELDDSAVAGAHLVVGSYAELSPNLLGLV